MLITARRVEGWCFITVDQDGNRFKIPWMSLD
jgi:hypothetical protein